MCTKFECGTDASVMVCNIIPEANLQPGEMIFYGKFPIKLTEVSGSNGIFSGKGRMRIPFLANIQVNMQFNGISVNELNEVFEGELVSIYNLSELFRKKIKINVPFLITGIYPIDPSEK